MTKKVEYDISVFELLSLIKHRWKLIGTIVVLCILLCGGYKALNGSGEIQETQSTADYERDLSVYDYYSETQQDFPAGLKNDWKEICYDRLNNPIFSVNPYNCEYEQIVVRFNDDKGNHAWTVSNWISKTDDHKLFQMKDTYFSDYKSSLVLVAQNRNMIETTEVAVQVVSVEDFDINAAADYLVRHFKQCAKEDNIDLSGISMANMKGYNRDVEAYQQNNRDKFNSISSALYNSGSMGSYIKAPQIQQENQGRNYTSIVKFCIMGLILGIIIGCVLALLDAIRKCEVISARQIENTFDLELLSDCSSGSEMSLDVLNANLDVMTENHSKIAIVADDTVGEISEISSAWSEMSDRSFIACTDIFDNPETIEALRTADGIVIGTKIGKSKLGQIQRVLLRAEKLNLKVLGYVLL